MTFSSTPSTIPSQTTSRATQFEPGIRAASKVVTESRTTNLHSLASLWARKYVASLITRDEAENLRRNQNFTDVSSKEGRTSTTRTLKQGLTLASAQAWSKTENLLSGEIQRHGISPDLIDPWGIAADSHNLFQKCLEAYSDRVTPRRLSVLVAADFGRIRRKYTANDPRTLGFVSMQFHYTGMSLLEQISTAEQALFAPYLKVMDDHLYMPLRAAYEAAANLEMNSPELLAVQQLLPISTKIAHTVCSQVMRNRPNYASYTGKLSTPPVRVSSVRDVEMFQVYLCLCALEGSIRSVQEELFPLCVMLYPRLSVSWELVQEMLRFLGWQLHDRLAPDQLVIFLPYLRALTEMFSLDVFQTA